MLTIALVCCILSTAVGFPPRCTDSTPFDLLAIALAKGQMVSDRVEVISVNGIKGYRFNENSITVGVDSEDLFSNCNVFPEEFSLLINFRHPSPRNTSEYLLALINRDRTPIFSVQLQGNAVIFDLSTSAFNGRGKKTKFKDSRLGNGEWHNIIISVSGVEVKFTIDCSKYERRLLEQKMDTIQIKRTKLYIASRGKKRKRYTGLLRQVTLLPGSDATQFTCPSSIPSLARLTKGREGHTYDQTVGRMIVFEKDRQHLTCSMKQKGQLFYTLQSTLKICTGQEFAGIKSSPLRMDYVVDYEDLLTVNNTMDIESFYIPNEGYFLATANRGSKRGSKSSIYKWNGEKFIRIQNVSSKEAQSWKYFCIGEEHFLALANGGTSKKKEVKSVIFRWRRNRRAFIRHQYITTFSARSWEAFTINERHFIAVVNHVDDQGNYAIPSEIYIWDADNRLFVPYQKLSTVGAVDVEFFEVLDFYFLVIANTFDGKTTVVDSYIYVWQNGKFNLFQIIKTAGAADWEFFEINHRFYLAVANTQYLAHNRTDFHVNSQIFELNIALQKFVGYQNIPTYGARDWEYFTIGETSFLILANISPLDASPLRTIIYKWQGVEKFVPVHNYTIDNEDVSDYEHLEIEGRHYLVMANALSTNSKLLEIVTY